MDDTVQQDEKKSMSNLSEKQAELLSAIPEDIRDAIAKLIKEKVTKQVDERVTAEVAKMEVEVKDLKDKLVELDKKKIEKPTGATSRIGGLTQRPQTAVRATNTKTDQTKRPGIENGDGSKSNRTGKVNGTPQISSGLKRPTTALIAGSRLGMPSKIGSSKDQKSPRVNGAIATKASNTNLRSRIGGPVVKSIEKDEIDEIYKEKDPIGVTIEKRKKSGQLTAVVPDPKSKSGKFFFTLSLKGDKPVISEKAKWANAKEMGLLDQNGNIKVVIDQKPCVIEQQLTMRLKEAGENITSVVQKKDVKEVEKNVFKLKLKGPQPQLKLSPVKKTETA